MPPETAAAMQYGSFGLLFVLVVWVIWKGIPQALEMHKNTITSITEDNKEAVSYLVGTFKAEAEACRSERKELYGMLDRSGQ